MPRVNGCAAASNESGCRGSAPTEAPHTRWRCFGPGTGRTAAGGSASGPAITLDNRSWRRAIKVATSITSAGTAGKLFLAALVLQRFRGCPDRGSPRSWPIIRRHSCACAASRDSHARSCGSNSRPSGVTSRPRLNEKPAQGPVRLRSRTIRLHATAGPRVEASSVPVWPTPCEHNIHYAKSWIGRIRAFVSSAWQWLGLWLGSCLRPGTPAKDEIAA